MCIRKEYVTRKGYVTRKQYLTQSPPPLQALLLVCMAMRIMNLAAKQVLAIILTIVGAAISPCRPCLNRCGRRVFGKGYPITLNPELNPEP